MKLPSLDKLLEDQVRDIYSAELQATKALPRMAKRASAAGLKEAFTAHLEETRGQVERLERVGELLGVAKLGGKKCVAMQGLVEEGKEVMEAEGTPELIDAALIISAQKIEHYEIAAYGSARTLAEHLGHDEVAGLLQETLDEESATDEKLTAVSVEEVLPGVSGGDGGEGGDDEPAPARPAGRAAASKRPAAKPGGGRAAAGGKAAAAKKPAARRGT